MLLLLFSVACKLSDRVYHDQVQRTLLLFYIHDHFVLGDELNALKDKAKKANSVYKWLKENWKKIFVIIVAIFALIVVVGIYRKCFSDSG